MFNAHELVNQLSNLNRRLSDVELQLDNITNTIFGNYKEKTNKVPSNPTKLIREVEEDDCILEELTTRLLHAAETINKINAILVVYSDFLGEQVVDIPQAQEARTTNTNILR